MCSNVCRHSSPTAENSRRTERKRRGSVGAQPPTQGALHPEVRVCGIERKTTYLAQYFGTPLLEYGFTELDQRSQSHHTHPNGNVVLVVGPKGVRLRVHSLLLQSASKVFNASSGLIGVKVRGSLKNPHAQFVSRRMIPKLCALSVALFATATTLYRLPCHRSRFFKSRLQLTSTTLQLRSHSPLLGG